MSLYSFGIYAVNTWPLCQWSLVSLCLFGAWVKSDLICAHGCLGIGHPWSFPMSLLPTESQELTAQSCVSSWFPPLHPLEALTEFLCLPWGMSWPLRPPMEQSGKMAWTSIPGQVSLPWREQFPIEPGLEEDTSSAEFKGAPKTSEINIHNILMEYL